MVSDLEYIQIVESFKKGLISVGVDRSYARKLFTDVQLPTIQENIGESLWMQKIIALTAFIVSPILVLLTCIFAIIAFGWWALLGLPLLLFVWMYYKSLSVRGGAGLGSISFIAVFAFALLLIETPSLIAPLLPFILGLWLERFLYCFTTHQFRALVLRNKKAFDLFQRGIVIKEVDRKL